VRRVARDVLGQPGVTDLLLFEGINDLGAAPEGVDVGMRIVGGYQSIIADAHKAGVRVIGATITPAHLTGAKESTRLAINSWIRTSGAFDAVVDFDAAVRDPSDPSRVPPAYDAYYAHLHDDGYAALAATVDLGQFQGTGCP
jgi:lysophospholipase L1-like esterase